MISDPSREKPYLLLLPGLPGTGVLFDKLAGELGEFFEIDAVSYPQDVPLDYDGLLNHVTSRIPKEKPYFLLGESFSGPLSVMAAARSDENLLGIILVATFVTNPMPRWIYSLRRFVDTPILNIRPRRFTNRRLMGRKCDVKTRVWIQKNMPGIKRKVLASRILSLLEVNVREELKGCQVPVLYIAGARDWLIGKKCIETIWLCRPDVEIKVIDGVHMILQTNAHDSAKAIIDFCGRVMGRSTFNVQRST